MASDRHRFFHNPFNIKGTRFLARQAFAKCVRHNFRCRFAGALRNRQYQPLDFGIVNAYHLAPTLVRLHSTWMIVPRGSAVKAGEPAEQVQGTWPIVESVGAMNTSHCPHPYHRVILT